MEECRRCAVLEREVAEMRGELAAVGRDQVQAETIADNDLERELARWITSTREPDALAGFRAGWHRLALLTGPRVREWERLWWRAMREQARLRSQIGTLLRETERLRDSG